jgi:hypothetical protein
MGEFTTAHSTPLDSPSASQVLGQTSVTKPKSGTSSFSLKDPLRLFRQKSAPSSSTTHCVKLDGLQKLGNHIRGMHTYEPLQLAE